MVKKLLLSAFISLMLTLPVSVYGQSIGGWKDYMAYAEISNIEQNGNTIYVLASNNLYTYNKTDKSIQTFDKTNKLSNASIAVRKNLEIVEEFRNEKRWDSVSQLDARRLKDNVSPLLIGEKDDEFAKRMSNAASLCILSKGSTTYSLSMTFPSPLVNPNIFLSLPFFGTLK